MRGITEERLKERLNDTDYHRSVECKLLRDLIDKCTELNPWQPIEVDEAWQIKGFRITRIGSWREHGEYYLFNGEVYEYEKNKKTPPELNGCFPPVPLIFLEKLPEDPKE